MISFQPILSLLRRRRRRSRLPFEPFGPIPPSVVVVRRPSEQNVVQQRQTGKQKVAAQNVLVHLSAVERRQLKEQTKFVEMEEAVQQLEHQGHVGVGAGIGRRLPIVVRTSSLQRRRRKRTAQSRKHRCTHCSRHSKLQK